MQGLVHDSGLVPNSREVADGLYSLLVEAERDTPPALLTRGYEASRRLSAMLEKVSRNSPQIQDLVNLGIRIAACVGPCKSVCPITQVCHGKRQALANLLRKLAGFECWLKQLAKKLYINVGSGFIRYRVDCLMNLIVSYWFNSNDWSLPASCQPTNAAKSWTVVGQLKAFRLLSNGHTVHDVTFIHGADVSWMTWLC